MSNFPNNFDDDTTLPIINDNITELGGAAVNALRDAVFAIEQNIGLVAQGTTPSIANRFGISFNPDGTLKPSAITSLGLVTLPITDSQISNTAQIAEAKLRLDHRTQDLFNYIRDLSKDVNLALGWISGTGVKLNPHLVGVIYRHSLNHIDVSTSISDLLSNKLRLLRDNSDSYKLIKDMNNELLAHQWADGSIFGNNNNITTNNGSMFSEYYAHTASGVFINTSRFNNIPQLNNDVQLFAEYIDEQSIFLLGTRIQNLYTNGISRVSRSSNLNLDGYGQFIVPNTPAIAYLKNINNSSSPVDGIDNGDDIIEFKPSILNQTTNNFDAQFALVKIGDIIRVNYGTVEIPFVIKEKKYVGTSGNKKYVVRIAGKNQFYSNSAIARIDRPLFNGNKFGELSISPVNNLFSGTPSLIINNPRGAQATGLGFNANLFDEKHYLLYLALYPTGAAQDGYIILPSIDVTGNSGSTPGLYSLESIVYNTNNAFRKLGYNYRFTAFSYQGEFGICLAESYNNSAFSIVSSAINTDGTIDTLANQINLPNNVIDLVPTIGTVGTDPLGMGPTGSFVASPPFYTTYGTPSNSIASQNPTKLFISLRRNTYYVNGTEKERLAREPSQSLDIYGDGYWTGYIEDISAPPNRVQVIYRIPLDLSSSGLKVGKTIVVQSAGVGDIVNFGRFIISDITFDGCFPNNFTYITVYDAKHATGLTSSPFIFNVIDNLNQKVNIYFGSDSVSFNTESATDHSASTVFKRHFEVYVNEKGETFTHERSRVNISGSNTLVNGVDLYGFPQLSELNIIKISPKLRGYQFGGVNKITLLISNYSSITGIFDGNLSSYDGISHTNLGPHIIGKKGQVTRFYDETNIDYIEFIFDINANISSFTNQVIDFQLFPTLSLDEELMLIGTCQMNDTSKIVNKIVDARQFGNTSEKDLSSSIFNIMSVPEKHLHSNGVIRGFDIFNIFNSSRNSINLSGGVVLVNGKILNINHDTISIPMIREFFSTTYYKVNWALCINDKGEYQTIPLLDYDSVLVTPSNTARIFLAADFINNNFYNLPAALFSDLINERTDLTVLYIFSSTITGTPSSPTITVTSKDTRRYVYKKDWSAIPSLVYGTENGEFRSYESLYYWLNLHSNYINTVNVRGVFPTFPTNYQFANKVKLIGDGASSFNINASSNTTNLHINYIDLITTNNLILSNSTLENVKVTGYQDLLISDSIFKNVTAISGFAGDYNFTNLVVNDSSLYVAGFMITSGGIFNNCTITIADSAVTNSLTSTNTTFNNVIFNVIGTSTVTFNNCILNNCTFTCTLSASTITFTGTSSVNGIESSLKNSFFDFQTTSCVLNLTGVVIGNKFKFSDDVTITLTDRFTVIDNKFYTSLAGNVNSQFLIIANNSNGLISQNYFIRNNSALSSYILAPSGTITGVVSIIDNYFDNTTFDGNDYNLVKNLPLTWIYKNNLNTPKTENIYKFTVNNTTAPLISGVHNYDVKVEDYILAINLSGSGGLKINLPNIATSPPGRVLIIKDAAGGADSNAITLHRNNINEAIENVYADYVDTTNFTTIRLVSSIDPNGVLSGFPTLYSWVKI